MFRSRSFPSADVLEEDDADVLLLETIVTLVRALLGGWVHATIEEGINWKDTIDLMREHIIRIWNESTLLLLRRH
jgi:hypothetical protein